jgi:hypothetical protein
MRPAMPWDVDVCLLVLVVLGRMGLGLFVLVSLSILARKSSVTMVMVMVMVVLVPRVSIVLRRTPRPLLLSLRFSHALLAMSPTRSLLLLLRPECCCFRLISSCQPHSSLEM